MGAFNGTLKSNEIFAGLYNMIISQQVFTDKVKQRESNAADDNLKEQIRNEAESDGTAACSQDATTDLSECIIRHSGSAEVSSNQNTDNDQ